MTVSAHYRLKTSRTNLPSIFDRIFGKSNNLVKPSKATRKPKSEKEAKERKN
jgi:hypothetical protein